MFRPIQKRILAAETPAAALPVPDQQEQVQGIGTQALEAHANALQQLPDIKAGVDRVCSK